MRHRSLEIIIMVRACVILIQRVKKFLTVILEWPKKLQIYLVVLLIITFLSHEWSYQTHNLPKSV